MEVRKVLREHQLRRNLDSVGCDVLIRDLEALKLPQGAVLLVHSSLKSLGFVEGGPQIVVQALDEVIVRRRGGTLVMPMFSIAGTMHATLAAGEVFDVRSTPSNLGAIPEAFRVYPGVRRSVHPTHSFGALGEKAEWIVKDHHLAGTSFGDSTPMVRAMEAGGWIAGLGTELGTVTFYHCLEDRERGFPVRVYSPDSPFKVECIDWDGVSHMLELPAHDSDVSRTRIDRPENDVIRSFFTRRFESEAGLEWINIGQGRGWYMPLQTMYAECRRVLRAGITIYTTPESLELSSLDQ